MPLSGALLSPARHADTDAAAPCPAAGRCQGLRQVRRGGPSHQRAPRAAPACERGRAGAAACAGMTARSTTTTGTSSAPAPTCAPAPPAPARPPRRAARPRAASALRPRAPLAAAVRVVTRGCAAAQWTASSHVITAVIGCGRAPALRACAASPGGSRSLRGRPRGTCCPLHSIALRPLTGPGADAGAPRAGRACSAWPGARHAPAAAPASTRTAVPSKCLRCPAARADAARRAQGDHVPGLGRRCAPRAPPRRRSPPRRLPQPSLPGRAARRPHPAHRLLADHLVLLHHAGRRVPLPQCRRAHAQLHLHQAVDRYLGARAPPRPTPPRPCSAARCRLCCARPTASP